MYFNSEDYENKENHITEIKEKPKKQKARLSFGSVIFIIILCIIVSGISGAGSAFFVYDLLIPDSSDTHTVSEEEYYDLQETVYVPQESVTVYATTQVYIKETAPVEVTTQREEVTTTKPSVTKNKIYTENVGSIVAISSTYNIYYNTLIGNFYRTATTSGTGFYVTSDGYIITNHHVIGDDENVTNITVTDYEGNKYEARLIGSEPENDIAVIKIDAVTVPVAIGNSSDLNVGDDIIVIGNALGSLSYSFTDGIVSHLSRKVKVESGATINMFQTNAAINKGNSGGPAFDSEGRVVGIASAKYASEEIEGLGFCIPIDDVKEMVSAMIIDGENTQG